MKTFKSTFSTGMLISTSIISSLLAFGVYTIVVRLRESSMDPTLSLVAISVLLLTVISVTYSYLSQIDCIILTDKELIIKKVVGQITISRTNIKRITHKTTLMRDFRIFGASGFFGHRGLFWNKASGKYHAYVKNETCMIEIKTTHKTYVVSCDDYQALLHSIAR